jgi:hypothetical protein
MKPPRCPRVWVCASRLLVCAIVMLPNTATARIDFSAGKTPGQLFNSDCSGCHHSPQGLAHSRNARALAGFLREHYTTKGQSAAVLADFLIRARAGNSTSRAALNSFLKIISEIWHKIATTYSWLIWQITKLLRA